MPVFLRTSNDLPAPGSFATGCSIGAPFGHELGPPLADLASRLEASFDGCAVENFALATGLAGDPSAVYAHAPACATNASDLGLMLAWSALVRDCAGEAETTLVICDDPWMFRHLAEIPGVDADRPPRLWPRVAVLRLRGALARLRAAAAMAWASVRLRHQRRTWTDGRGAAALLIYAHPRSDEDGTDGYFGSLMKDLPALRRVLHVDCPPWRARRLAGQRTTSLHAWGDPVAALGLVFARWRPSARHRRGPYGWLVRRAAAIEGGTAQGAMIRWQQICHDRWLSRARPAIVTWPWENHSWERDFVRRARALGVRTVGYQHATIGRRERNYAAVATPDGLAAAPDRIVASGPLGRAMLERLGWPADRVEIGGALRYGDLSPIPFDPAGPVFVALPFDAVVAGEMVEAARRVAGPARRFLVKDHPMTPFAVTDGPYLRRCATTLREQNGLSAVVYAGTSVGLEAMIGGLPTIRFQPRFQISVDTLPEDRPAPVATAETLGAVLDAATRPPPIAPEEVFARPAIDRWRLLLSPTCGGDGR